MPAHLRVALLSSWVVNTAAQSHHSQSLPDWDRDFLVLMCVVCLLFFLACLIFSLTDPLASPFIGLHGIAVSPAHDSVYLRHLAATAANAAQRRWWHRNLLPFIPPREDQRPLRGGARRANLNNRGTGGKSKAPKQPVPMPQASKPKSAGSIPAQGGPTGGSQQSQGTPAQGPQVVDVKDYADRFSYAAPPLCRTQFHVAEQISRDTHFDYDCDGAPFCGFTCIDIAVGDEPDLRRYQPYMTTADPLDAGNQYTLSRYAASRGVNLTIIDEQDNLIHRNMHNPVFSFVVLRYQAPPAGSSDGHFVLVCSSRASNVPHGLPEVHREPARFSRQQLLLIPLFFFLSPGWFIAATVVLGLRAQQGLLPLHEVLYTSDKDRRPVMDRRDRLESGDKIILVRRHTSVSWFGLELFSIPRGNLLVSVVRLLQAYSSAQSYASRGLAARKACSEIASYRCVNTDPSLPILRDTAEYLAYLIDNTIEEGWTLSPSPVTVFNSSGHELNLGAAAQAALATPGARLRGGVLRVADGINSILRYRLKEPKVRVPVAEAPIGAVASSKGWLGPGRYVLTDSYTLLAAFVSRSMNQRQPVPEELDSFLRFSLRFVKALADATPIERVVEDQEDRFRRLQKGKMSASAIDAAIEDYHSFCRGAPPVNYCEHSCFVKFENSSKGDGTKPRLIMTMSPRMKYECCGVLDLIEQWNRGPFGRFQVKDLDPDAMIERICKMSFGDHAVTDYSAFESSVNHIIRRIENSIILRLCHRANEGELARAFRRHAFGGRTLKSKYGRFEIFTRCSGDYWTSFGNGVVNVCINAYAHYRRHGTVDGFTMIAEGDDGLVPLRSLDPEIARRLGFSFSSDLRGTGEGSCDFLRSLWFDGKRYLNIARCMSVFWVKNGTNLRRSKQLFLLRAAANSLYWLSPGHPVLTAVINRIRTETRSVQPFKGWQRYLDRWAKRKYVEIARGSVQIQVDESMRQLIAMPVRGNFPALPIADQLELERRFREDRVVCVGNMLDSFEETAIYEESYILADPQRQPRESDDYLMLKSLFS